ncbi:hypothetical protein D3C86_2020140 [compost metagenome]
MKFNRKGVVKPTHLRLCELECNETYRDIRTTNIWLVCLHGWVDLTNNRVVTQSINMPGQGDPHEPRFVKVKCFVDVQEI